MMSCQMVGDGDRHQRQHEESGELHHRQLTVGNLLGEPREAQVDQEEQERRKDQHDSVEHDYKIETELVELEKQWMEQGLRGDPFQKTRMKRRFLEPVEGHRREHQKHEHRHG